MTPLDLGALRAALLPPHGPYAELDVMVRTGSTNADVGAAAAAGAADGTVLLAEQQTDGRGRHQRRWVSPAGAGIYLSVLLRTQDVPPTRLGWLTLLAGVAVVETVRECGVADAELKWPNDVLAGGGKLAGILAEAVPSGGEVPVVVGIGLNVAAPAEPVAPGPGGLAAVSLTGLGARVTDRTELAIGLLARFAELRTRWQAAAGDARACGLLDRYRRYCATIGREVRIELANGDLLGTAEDVDADGRLLLRTEGGGRRPVSAGDVVHLR